MRLHAPECEFLVFRFFMLAIPMRFERFLALYLTLHAVFELRDGLTFVVVSRSTTLNRVLVCASFHTSKNGRVSHVFRRGIVTNV